MKIFLLLPFLVFSILSSAQQVRLAEVNSIEDYKTALKVAREKEHMLFVALHDGGGAFRQMFDNKVFAAPQVKNKLQPYMAMALDVRSDMGSRWVDIFPTAPLPSFYFLNEEEFLLRMHSGYLSADSLAYFAREASANRYRYDSLFQAYKQRKLSASQWQELLRLHGLNFPFSASLSLALEFLNGQPKDSLQTPPEAAILENYGLDLETPYPAYVQEHQQALEQNLPHFDFADFYARVYSYNLDLAILNEDSLLLETLMEQWLPFRPQDNDTARGLLETYRLFARETGMWGQWAKGAFRRAEAAAQPDTAAQMLYREGFKLADQYEDTLAYQTAYQMAQKAMEYQPFFKAAMLGAYSALRSGAISAARADLEKARKLARSEKQTESVSKLEQLIQRRED